MDETKKQVPFKWEFGEETVSLEIGQYAYGERLYIGITSHTRGKSLTGSIYGKPFTA